MGYPFVHAGPVAPGRLIDRHDELRLLGRAAGERTPIRLAAPRRFGKTSVLAAHADALGSAGWRAVRVDLTGVTDIDSVHRALLAAWRPHREVEGVRRAERLAARVGIEVSALGPPVQLAPRGAVRSEGSSLLEDLLDLPAELHARTGTPTLVVLDEFQDLLVAGERLDGRVRSVIQHHGEAAAYVFSGSEPSMLAAMFDERERPLYGQAEPLGLGPLPIEATIDAVQARFAELELDPGDAAAALCEVARGHPQRTMLLAHLLCRRLEDEGPGTAEEHVDAVLAEALEQTAETHAATLAPLSRTQRVVLGEIAHGRTPNGRDLPARQHATRAAFGQAASALVGAGQLLVRDERAGWRIVDPLLELRLGR